MTLTSIQKFCATLPHAKAEVKWQVDLVHTIGGKMFAVTCPSADGPPRVSFKVDDDLFLQYTDREGFIPAPYLARAKWVQVIDLKRVSDSELKSLLRRSYELVGMKLTKAVQRELGLIATR
jgi:predicted DNA-binding protein (MmcQ/YjbR family)